MSRYVRTAAALASLGDRMADADPMATPLPGRLRHHPYAHPYAYDRHCWWRDGVRVCN